MIKGKTTTFVLWRWNEECSNDKETDKESQIKNQRGVV